MYLNIINKSRTSTTGGGLPLGGIGGGSPCMYDSGLMRVSDLDSEAGAEVLYVEEGELKAILLGRELKAGTTEREYVSLTCIQS